MTEEDAEYFQRRAREHVMRARKCEDSAIAAIHRELADAYVTKVSKKTTPPGKD